MPGSIGLFRAESVDYVLVKAQQGGVGALQFQYLMLPATALRALGGNVRMFEAFAKEPIPTFQTLREDLPPFQFDGLEPADAETQTDDLLSLMSFCKNNLKTVGGLLSGLVQAMGIAVLNAPPSLTDRLTFVQGLLTLLPRPVRAGITWATNVIDPSQTNVQVKFMTWDVRPNRHLIFDWATGKLLNDAPEDAYSNFILSQLRLDTSLVIEQTGYLERTAIWRSMRKDDLANSLSWASRRASLDSAILSGQPADPKMVAGVLREDPTLSDEMREKYAKHMLTLTLSLDEPERSDILAPISAKYRNVADAVFEYLKDASADEARAEACYHLLSRWITHAPDLEGARWRPLLGRAFLAQMNKVVATGDVEKLNSFLHNFIDAPQKLGLDSAMAQAIGMSRTFAYNDAQAAKNLFLLAATYLPLVGLQRLLSDPQLVAKLPEAIRATLPHFGTNAPRPAPAGVLYRAANAYGPERRLLILARLSEWALLIQRPDLLDADMLRGLVEVGLSPLGDRYNLLIEHVGNDLSQAHILRSLDSASIRLLVALSLSRGRAEFAVAQLEFYQNEMFKGSSAEAMNSISRGIFGETKFALPVLENTFTLMQSSQLRTSVRANAYFGALQGRDWSLEVDFISRRLTETISNDASLVQSLGFDNVLRLMKTMADRHDVVNTLRISTALVENTLILGSQGPELVERLFGLINWGPEMVASSMEVLRTYVRRAPLSYARALVDTSTKRYGDQIGKGLEATYRVRLLLGNGNTFANFVEAVRVTSMMLQDMAATYHESQEMPSVIALRRTVEGMTGGLNEAERERLAGNLYRIADQILQLSKRRSKNSQRKETQNMLANNQVSPTTGLDALRWVGGHFAPNKVTALRLERAQTPHLMGSRSVNMLLRETDLAVLLFDNLLLSLPEGMAELDNDAFRAEIDSQWAFLNLYTQRQLMDGLAEHAHLLADVIIWIGERGNERSLSSNGYGLQLQKGRTQPRGVIDCLRWINGYFMKQHS
jgi:hypothetical protein